MNGHAQKRNAGSWLKKLGMGLLTFIVICLVVAGIIARVSEMEIISALKVVIWMLSVSLVLTAILAVCRRGKK